MTQEMVIYIAREALSVALLVSAPMLLLGMLVGIIVSIFQATTQIQEQTLTFVPKIIVVMFSMVIFGPWMLTIITQFTYNLFSDLPKFIY
ncbi:component of the flagellar export machinery [Tepidanaerobacter acetatoxydans Re1]|uniref:Flagellar biosynthetic protein FliQ n=1 Tax=Tepidanaerobacter acetatoxydans (strain DSM 21804 / JCM 16047 / Re1) TaxID=1209989 RepID=F4LTQ4_TEPAE|nr:flagellar biosynthesis protein FliQ [Tepidanaerobacter acetatoxydans]AEE91384.1 flagellar biosynthetic protein FliQ [Tepidanaerobacter acetatoxydans Re1]CCP26081.1 component of the flagellar export machinery [Tepidanaerobacter acetatoxydans Re1]